MMPQRSDPRGRLGASFRDPSGFLFLSEGNLYRQINQVYAEEYDRLMASGLYERLVEAGLLIAHEEVRIDPLEPSDAYKVIQPNHLEIISYPYEWPFSLYKDAALAMLQIQREALKFGMSLKDASAYNIQFDAGQVKLIDTLSFEEYEEGKPWIAYRQFCQHFLAPLALMEMKDIQLGQLMRIYIDGIPIGLASRLLPWNSRLSLGILMHVHMHTAAQRRSAGRDRSDLPRIASGMSRHALIGLIESLETTVKKLHWDPGGTEWADYYSITNYGEGAFDRKKACVIDWIKKVKPASVWDLGANDGTFSRLASEAAIPTIAFDIDPSAVETNYLQIRSHEERNLIPLVLDLTNPSPAIGWRNQERESFFERGPAEMVLSLALIHHLAISNNVPLPQLVDFHSDLGKWLIIEFIPKSDSQVQRLLRNRKDIFPHYNQTDFESAFKRDFRIHDRKPLPDSERTLYLMERKH